MAKQPLVTFIVTAYNLPLDFLQECLRSIMSLSLNKDQREIILVDDGSVFSLINELGDIRDDIIYIRQPNKGLSTARNIGLKMANGIFIQFVDGDDCLIQAEYEHCLDIVRYNEPVDMVLFLLTRSKNQPVDFSFEGPMTGIQYMEKHNLRASACGYIFRANRLGNLRFTPNLLHEDEEFTPQLVLHMHNLYSTRSRAYFYRKRKDSITHSSSKKERGYRLDDIFDIILKLKTIVSNFDDEEKKKALNRRIAQLSMDYIVNVIRLTRSHKKLSEAIRRMSEYELYPLPDKKFTSKYVIFNHLIRNKVGRMVLIALL